MWILYQSSLALHLWRVELTELVNGPDVGGEARVWSRMMLRIDLDMEGSVMPFTIRRSPGENALKNGIICFVYRVECRHFLGVGKHA